MRSGELYMAKLWFNPGYREIESYYARRTGGNLRNAQMAIGDNSDVKPLLLRFGDSLKDEITLDEIDSVLCGFNDEKAFRAYLEKYSVYDGINSSGSLTITGYKNGDVKYYEVIFNNPFLKKYASIIGAKRRDGTKEKELFLDRNDEDIKNYIKKIAQYAVGKNTGESLRSFDILPPHVKQVLREYKEKVEAKDDAGKHSCFERLFGYCMNYKTLRAFVIWESKHKAEEHARRSDAAQRAAAARRDVIERIAVADEFALGVQTEREGMGANAFWMFGPNGQLDPDAVHGVYDLSDLPPRIRASVVSSDPTAYSELSGRGRTGKKK